MLASAVVRKIFRLFISLTLFLCVSSCKKSAQFVTSEDKYFPKFEKEWELYLKSSSGGWENNFKGRFSWDDAYALEGLVLHYERSKDNRYLDTFVKVASRIFNAVDENSNIQNKYRGNRKVKGWSTNRYTFDSSLHVFGVTNAMILFPILKLYKILIDGNSEYLFRNSFFDKAFNFALLEFNDIHSSDWIDVSPESGYFQDPYYSSIGIITPVNQYSRIGSYAIELYKLTGNSAYLNYAKKIARHLKSNLIYKTDYFYWNYIISKNPSTSDQPEDIGHSILVIQFIVNCYKNNIVFVKDDIKSLVNLFKTQLYIPNSNYFNEYLNGNIISNDPYISHYYMLSEFDAQIYHILTNWLNQQNFILNPNSFLNHFGNKLILLNAFDLYYK